MATIEDKNRAKQDFWEKTIYYMEVATIERIEIVCLREVASGERAKFY